MDNLDAIPTVFSLSRNFTVKCIKCRLEKAEFLFQAENECETKSQNNKNKNCENDINEEYWHTTTGGLTTCN